MENQVAYKKCVSVCGICLTQTPTNDHNVNDFTHLKIALIGILISQAHKPTRAPYDSLLFRFGGMIERILKYNSCICIIQIWQMVNRKINYKKNILNDIISINFDLFFSK